MMYKKIILSSVVALTSFTLGCSQLKKSEELPLEGEGVTIHSLADGQVELRMKISGLTSSLWITTELWNNSGQSLQLTSQNLLQFEEEKCLDVRQEVNEILSPLAPQERRRFRFAYYWKGRKKKDPLYEQCSSTPLRFKLNGLVLGQEKLTTPSWTIEP